MPDLEFIKSQLFRYKPLNADVVEQCKALTGHHPHDFYEDGPFMATFSVSRVNEAFGIDEPMIPLIKQWTEVMGEDAARFVAELPGCIRPIWYTNGERPSDHGVF